MSRLDPTLDLVFRLLLLREPSLLLDMLEGILARPLHGLTILDADIPGELTLDKEIILDIRAELYDGTRVDVEMQIRSTLSLASRLVFYGARDYADQVGRGDDYTDLTPTIVIIWLVEPLFPTLDRLHSTFELRERHTHALFSAELMFHVLQLSYLSPSCSSGYTGKVERWARFLTARSDAEFDQLASEDPIMHTAKDALDRLSEDPAVRRLARKREDDIKLYKIDIATNAARARVEGKADVLLKQLGLRFGPLSEPIRARVELATTEQLDRWIERILTAPTLAEVFA